MEVKPVSEQEKQKLRNRAACMDRVNTYINSVVPVLIAQLETGFKVKVSGELYEKDRNLLRGILRAVKCPLSRGIEGRRGSSAYVSADEYSIKIEVVDVYESKGFHDNISNDRYQRTVYLWNHQSGAKYDFEPLKFHTGQEMIEAKERLQVVLNEVSLLNDEASGLKRLIGGNY